MSQKRNIQPRYKKGYIERFATWDETSYFPAKQRERLKKKVFSQFVLL